MAALGVLRCLAGDSPQGLAERNSTREGGGAGKPTRGAIVPTRKDRGLYHPASGPSGQTAVGGAMSGGPIASSPALVSGDCPGHSHGHSPGDLSPSF